MNIVLTASMCLLGAVVPVTEDTWPAFRGDGASVTPAEALPLRWSPTENIAWEAPIRGYGQSSPVVWKNRAFVTSVEGDEKETSIVTAVDVATGAALWQHTLESAQRIENTSFVSKAAPTPVVDANGVYVFFEAGNLLALSHEGKVLWERNLVEDYGVTHLRHGLGSSLAHNDDSLFVLIEAAEPSLLVAFVKADGAERWKTGRDGRTSWTTPIVAVGAGQESIFITSGQSFTQYDVNTGKLLTGFESLAGISIPSPAVSGDIVVVGANSTRPTKGDRTAEQSNCAIRLASSEAPDLKVLWEGDGAQADYASPLIYEGNVYLVTKRGDVQCRDLATGKVHYTERLHPCWATPFAAGDRIYLFGKEGACTVIAAGNAFKVLSSSRLWPEDITKPEKPKEEESDDPRSAVYEKGDIIYGVAVVDRTILVRVGDKLYALRETTTS